MLLGTPRTGRALIHVCIRTACHNDNSDDGVMALQHDWLSTVNAHALCAAHHMCGCLLTRCT